MLAPYIHVGPRAVATFAMDPCIASYSPANSDNNLDYLRRLWDLVMCSAFSRFPIFPMLNRPRSVTDLYTLALYNLNSSLYLVAYTIQLHQNVKIIYFI